MTNTDTPVKKVHEGYNLKRFREMLGVKQDTLAYELGNDWNQQKISHLETKETIEPELLEQIAKILKVTPDSIRNFSEDSAINIIANTFTNNDHSAPQFANTIHNTPTFNPLDKVVELYERLLKEKDERIKKLEGK